MRIYPKRLAIHLLLAATLLILIPVIFPYFGIVKKTQKGKELEVPSNVSRENVTANPLTPKRWPRPQQKMEMNNGPVLVAMVTYQRSGSSFLGEIFNQNPSAFEWFEPLDGVYSALYGTEYGHNVPADIWNLWNGSVRVPPQFETEVQARVAAAILTCNLKILPTEVLLHHFIGMFLNEHKRMKPYYDCVSKKRKNENRPKTLQTCRFCNVRLAKLCGKRFGQNSGRQKLCSQALQPYIYEILGIPQNQNIKSISNNQIQSAVDSYKLCMSACRRRALSCLPSLQSVCDDAPVRAIKPVRFSMEAAAKLLDILPQTKLLHNLRDPRGVVMSRKNTSSSFQAAYAGALLKPMNAKHDIIKEAVLFCRNAYSHSQIFNYLEIAHPDSVMQVIYEKYASEPYVTAQDIYNFLGLNVPDEVFHWLEENTKESNRTRSQTTRNSTSVLSHWQRIMKPKDSNTILEVCKDLYNITGHVWKNI